MLLLSRLTQECFRAQECLRHTMQRLCSIRAEHSNLIPSSIHSAHWHSIDTIDNLMIDCNVKCLAKVTEGTQPIKPSSSIHLGRLCCHSDDHLGQFIDNTCLVNVRTRTQCHRHKVIEWMQTLRCREMWPTSTWGHVRASSRLASPSWLITLINAFLQVFPKESCQDIGSARRHGIA